MNVLIGCEFSGIVREEFRKKGHNAWSCDLENSEIPGKHIKGDLLKELNGNWDLLIALPPCKYLSYAGAGNWNDKGREEKRERGLKFFMELYNAPIKRVCVENPNSYVRIAFRKPDQEIHPYYFGDREMKRTCLWLRGLKKLSYVLEPDLFMECKATKKPEPSWIRKDGNKQYFCSVNRTEKNRSRFWVGIAKEMAEQWGKK